MSMLFGLKPTMCGHRTSTSEWFNLPVQARTGTKVYTCGGLGGYGFRAGLPFAPVKAIPRQVIRTSYDNEFRDSRSIALGLHKRYKDVQSRGFSNNNLKEFIRAGVTAYEVGCTDEGMRKELLSIDLNELSDEETEERGSVGLKSRLATEDVLITVTV